METLGHEPTPPNYRERILEILQEFEVKVPERAIRVACELLEKMYKEHGDPNSESYKPYHNDLHALNVIRRSLRLWKLWKEIVPDDIDEEGFELLLIAGAGHDLVVHSGKDVGYDERESGYIIAAYMNEAGYSKEQIERVFEAVVATTVVRDENGHIIQTFILEGKKDPLKLALATADTNGTTMDGTDAMAEDVVNLYAESEGKLPDSRVKIARGVTAFFQAQLQFVNDRIEMLKEDLEYYFGEKKAKKIYTAHIEEFTDASPDVMSLAKTIHSFPEMAADSIEAVVNSVKALGGTALHEIKAGLKKKFKRKKHA